MNLDSVKKTIEELLRQLELDQENENFRETPDRVARFWFGFLNRPEPVLKDFESCCLDEIKLQGYETWGLCPHHLLPVKYIVDVSYTPNGRVFGISKLPRIVDHLLRTLPLQEDLPLLVVNYLKEHLNPLQVSCSVEGMHLCMTMRGVKAKDCTLKTSAHWFNDSIYEEALT